jgi:hypothetical protein
VRLLLPIPKTTLSDHRTSRDLTKVGVCHVSAKPKASAGAADGRFGDRPRAQPPLSFSLIRVTMVYEPEDARLRSAATKRCTASCHVGIGIPAASSFWFESTQY